MDRKPLILFSLAVVAALSFTALQGCDLEDLVQVKLEPEVQEALDEPARVSLSESRVVWQRWQDYVERTTTTLSMEISDADRRYNVLLSLVSTSFDALSDHSSTLPGGLLITSALSGLGGLFLNKPGAKKREFRARADGFKKGIEAERDSATS